MVKENGMAEIWAFFNVGRYVPREEKGDFIKSFINEDPNAWKKPDEYGIHAGVNFLEWIISFQEKLSWSTKNRKILKIRKGGELSIEELLYLFNKEWKESPAGKKMHRKHAVILAFSFANMSTGLYYLLIYLLKTL